MNETLETTIGKLLRARGLRLATAESCTGGLIGDRITNTAGSSDYFLGGIIAYANEIKQGVLGVSGAALEAHGAVSEPVALAMARGACRVLGADIALSVTGVAGPGGGTAAKPVGLTWIGLSAPDGTWAHKFIWDGTRTENKAASAQAALELLQGYLEKKPS